MKMSASTAFRYLFLSGVFLIPLVYWPWAAIPFEIPKVWFVNRWVEILGLIGIIFFPQLSKNKKIDWKLACLVLSFFIFVTITSLSGSNFSKSFWGNYYRSDGLLTLAHLVSLFFIISLFFDKGWKLKLFKVLGLGVFTTSFIALVHAVLFYVLKNQAIPNFDGAIGATFGQPKFLTGYLLVTLPFIFNLIEKAKSQKENLFWKVTMISSILSIIFTKSKIGLVGIPLIFFIKYLFTKGKKNKKLLAALLLVVVLISSIFIYDIYRSKIDKRFVAEGRTRIFTKAYLAFLKKPYFGWGWANFDYAFDSVIWPIKIGNDVYVDKAHSNFLEILVTTGVVGFALYLLILAKIFTNLYKQQRLRNTYLFVFLLFVLHSQTNVISIAEETIFWILAGIASQRN